MSEAPLLTASQLALIREPIVQSLLYDCNLLPESLLALNRGPGQHRDWGYLLAVLTHFKVVFEERDELIAALEYYLSTDDGPGSRSMAEAAVAKVRGARWKCKIPDEEGGGFDHDWEYKSGWYGDPGVINGTCNIYYRVCRQCGEEEPVSSSDMPTFEDDVL